MTESSQFLAKILANCYLCWPNTLVFGPGRPWRRPGASARFPAASRQPRAGSWACLKSKMYDSRGRVWSFFKLLNNILFFSSNFCKISHISIFFFMYWIFHISATYTDCRQVPGIYCNSSKTHWIFRRTMTVFVF